MEGQTANPYADRTLADVPPSKVASVLAMDQLGLSKVEMAAREKISRTTVYAILKQGDHLNPEVTEQVKKHLAAHYWVSAERSLQHITDEKLQKASANALMWTAGVATDKALLLEGKPTARVEFKAAVDPELEAQLSAVQAELDGWKDGAVDVVGVLEGGSVESPTEGHTTGELHNGAGGESSTEKKK
jgi:hypothetical protein